MGESQSPFLKHLLFIEEFLLDRIAKVKWQLMKPLLEVTEGRVHECSAEFGHEHSLGEMNSSNQYVGKSPLLLFTFCVCVMGSAQV